MTNLIIPPMKFCSKCGNGYPATNEFFHRDKTKQDGLYTICKDCTKLRGKEWRKNNAEKKQRMDKEYRQKNKDKIAEYKRQWVARQIEKDPTYNQRRHLKRREKARKHNRQYYIQNRVHLIQRSAEYSKTHRQETNKYKLNNIHKRRAIKKGLPSTFTDTHWQKALDYFGGKCAVCGRPQGLWHILARDHWIPVTHPDYPGHIPTNVVPLCHGDDGCNNSKGAKMPDVWLKEQYSPRRAKEIIERIEAYFEWVHTNQ